MPRADWVGEDIYGVGSLFVDECLRSDGSLFTPGRPVWSAERIDDLYDRFVVHSDTGTGSFMQKLEQQLGGAQRETIQLAAEAVYFNYLCESDTGPLHKRDTVHKILGWMVDPVLVPPALDNAYSSGLASIGLAKTQKWQQIAFLLEFVRAWKALDPSAVEEQLGDWRLFRTFVHQVPKHSASVQIEGLLHLVFPERFEPIVSPAAKQRIADAFSEYLGGEEPDVDEKIESIREALSDEYGQGFSFYDSSILPRWNSKSTGKIDGGAWLVRGANNRAVSREGTNMLAQWFREGFVSIGWRDARPFPTDADVGEIRRQLEAQGVSPQGEVFRGAGIVQRFLAMQSGDLVLTPDDDSLYVARVSGLPYWVEGSDESALRCPVEWLNLDQPGSRAEVKQTAPALYSSLRTLLTVSNLAAHVAAIAALADGYGPQEPADPLGALADELTMAESEIRGILKLIERKRQAIFYGPPGTGKTFVALRLARYLAGDAARVRLVQFHANYSYEDFVEGYRPTVIEGQAGFRVSAGPLRDLAAAAEDHPEQRFVLVIDELNRGNVAKVFGELYFLLEYRNELVTLQYSGEEFRLPPNLFVIGTMNTADRTIALLDAALRRRFYFVPFFPGRPPVGDLLRRWLANHKPDYLWVADVVDRANAKLADAHLAIGHSYFIDNELDESLVREVWDHAIIPTIEEHYFGQVERVREFDLDRLRSVGQAEELAVDAIEEEKEEAHGGEEPTDSAS